MWGHILSRIEHDDDGECQRIVRISAERGLCIAQIIGRPGFRDGVVEDFSRKESPHSEDFRRKGSPHSADYRETRFCSFRDGVVVNMSGFLFVCDLSFRPVQGFTSVRHKFNCIVDAGKGACFCVS